MRLLFFGSGAFGLPTLQRLASKHELLAIVSQPDRPAGRGSKLTPTPIAEHALTHLPHVPLHRVEKVNPPEIRDHLRSLNADAWVVIAFGQKLGKALLDNIFAINLHGSILPRWRGAAPINAAILAGDPIAGNSVITLADRMDAGLVLGTSSRPLLPEYTTGDLHDLLSADGPDLVERVLTQHAAGTLAPETQDESLVTIAPKFSKTDGWVDFAQPAEECRRRIHGLNPWPAVTITFRNEPMKLLRVQAMDAGSEQSSAPGGSSVPHAPGTLLDGPRGLVACGSGTLRLIEVQPAGKRAMSWDDFARGRTPAAGEQLIGGRPAC